jgi:hypothetical protein
MQNEIDPLLPEKANDGNAMQPLTEYQDYTHPELGREVTAIGGHYVFGKEIRLAYDGREILCFVGYAALDTACCGSGGCAYVYVPGFIEKWKYRMGENNCPVSQVEPIRNPAVQKKVRSLLQDRETVFQVNFN